MKNHDACSPAKWDQAQELLSHDSGPDLEPGLLHYQEQRSACSYMMKMEMAVNYEDSSTYLFS